MNGLLVCGLISIVIYSILYDWTFCAIYLLMVSGYFLLSYIFVPSSSLNTWRSKLLISSWSDPDSPEVHTHYKVRVSKALNFIEQFNQKTGKKITITHLVVKCAGDSLSKYRDFAGKFAFGYYVPYTTIDISILVALDEGKDLAAIKIESVDKKTLSAIADEVDTKLKELRTGGKALKVHKTATLPFRLIPSFLSGVAIEICSYLSVPLGMDLLGIKNSPCGSIAVTNLGSQGTEVGYAPFPCPARVGIVCALSAIREEAIVEDGKIVAEKILTLLNTGDHRYGDGTQGVKISNEVSKRLENPEEYLTFD